MKGLLTGYKKAYQPLADACYDILIGGDGQSMVAVLETYQNPDGGFGHGLEADIQMPESNVASTDMAMNLLSLVTHPSKYPMIQAAIGYYESVFNHDTLSFEMVPKEVDDHPHAIWWNYKDIASFGYGNPNPEILGTFLQYKDLVQMNIKPFYDKVIHYILHEMKDTDQMHSIMSSLMLYERAPIEVKDILRDSMIWYCNKHVVTDPEKWDEYGFEPYKVFLLAPSLFGTDQPGLEENIKRLQQLLQNGKIEPNWQWFQYDGVFEEVKDQWSILLTFDAIRAIQNSRKQ